MVWQATPYTFPAVLAGLLAATLGLFVWRRRRLTRGSAEFAAFALAVTILCLADALAFANAEVPGKTFWTKFEYVGVVAVPPLWLVCVARYCGLDGWLTSRRLVLLALVPTITLVLVATNEWHGLIWSSIGVVTNGTFMMWVATYGPWFWVHFAYSYLALGAATLLIARFLVRSHAPFSGQGLCLLLGMSVPWVANILYFAHLSPFPYLDLTPFGFALGSVGVALGLTRFRLFDLVPIARAALVEALPDAVLVLDAGDRIVDLNPAARRLIGPSAASAIGSPVGEVLSWWQTSGTDALNPAERLTALVLAAGDRQRHFDVRVCSLVDSHRAHVGRLVLLQDTTERERAEEERAKRIREEAAHQQAESGRRRAAFLANVSRQLTQSLELDTVLIELERLVVPAFADGIVCILEDEAGSDRRIAIRCARAADAELFGQWRGAPQDWTVDVALALLEDVTERGLLSIGCAPPEVQLWLALQPRSILHVPLRSADRCLGSIWLFTTCSDRQFGPEDLELANDLGQRVVIALANVRLYHAARLETAERRRAEEAFARVAVQEQALADFEHQALSGADLSGLLAGTTHLVGTALGAEHVAILQRSNEPGGNSALRVGASFGWPAESIELLPSSLVAGGGPRSRDELVTIENWDDVEVAGASARSPLLRQNDVHSSAVIVIRFPDDQAAFGWLEVDARLPNAVTHSDLAFLQRVAHVLAVAIERQRAQESLQRYARALVTVQEDERSRLARDLHDEVGGQLTGLHFLLGAVAQTRPNASFELGQARSIVSQLIAQIRDLSAELRPATLDDFGLLAAVQSLVKRYATLTGIHVGLEHSDVVGRFPAMIEIAAYRIVQEALTNTARHASIQSAVVRVLDRGAYLEVTVEDSGRGFDVEQVIHRAEATGLSGMRERAAASGGSLSIFSQPGMGTRVSARFPLEELPRSRAVPEQGIAP